MGDIEKTGVHFSYHSDMPMAPAQPLFLIDCAVNRITFNGNISAPEQRVTRMGALKAVTIEAAYSWQMEKQIGSIEPGKLANFTVLEDNPLTVDALKIKDIKVWGTMHEGKVIPVKKSEKSKPSKMMKLKPAKIISTQTTSTIPTSPTSRTKSTSSVSHPGHTHTHGGDLHTGCACAMNQKLGQALFAESSEKQ